MLGRYSFCAAVVVALGAAPAATAAPVRYAGVEVGPKWVTGVVVEIDDAGAKPAVKVLTMKVTVTTLGLLRDGKFRPELVAETATDVGVLVARFKAEFNVPAENVRVVAGNAVAVVPNRADLEAAIQAKADTKLTYATTEEEVRLTRDGLALLGDTRDALVVTVGDGDTRGGYDAETFAVGFGTVSFTATVRAAAGDTFAAKAAAAKAAEVAPALATALRAKTGLKQKTPVTLTGGAAWALATLTRPATVDLALVPLTAADLRAFKALLAKTPGRFPQVDTSGIADAAARKRADREVARVRDAFSTENLVAGAELLDAVFAAFEWGDRPVTFARAGEVALAAAAVTPERVRIAARPARPVAVTPVPKVPDPKVVDPKVPTPKVPDPKVAELKMPDPVPPAAPPAVVEAPQPAAAAPVVGPRVVTTTPARVGGVRVGLFGRLRCR